MIPHLFVPCLCLLGVTKAQQNLFPSKQSMASWSKRLDEKFESLLTGDSDITGAVKLEKTYMDNFEGDILHADGESVVRQMQKDISSIFDKNIEALWRLQRKAEQLVKDYKYNKNLVLSDVEFNNVNEVGNETLTYDDHYKQDVNLSRSGVHIPIEIYEGYPVILNGINWSQNLTEAFIENRNQYKDIYWQSYGSQDGFLRTYPLSKWQTVEDLPDLYDVRRRPWYIHGTSSPKDMVILLDTSGSMHGQSFDIMKLAAKTLINTLGENDYVNVASFSENVTWVTPCLSDLVQANTRNKRLLFDGIDSLEARFMANYSNSLEFAYVALENFELNRESGDESGANCHKLIMIFSDGGTEYPDEIIKVYTNETRTITRHARIFTYAVGPHPLPTVALKDMACDTKGSFNTITAMGAIRTTIQGSYVNIITRPEVLSSHRGLQFSSIYGNALGLGFVTTVTLPVFNTSVDSDNQTLAGIVGIDIPITRLERFAPRAKLGPLGYAFAMNTNGFLIFHPSLWMVENYLEDPAHNDFADIEGDSEQLSKIRREMIDLAFAQDFKTVKMKEVNISTVVQHGHAIPTDLRYFFSAIKSTNFSLGIVVPKEWKYAEVPDAGNNLKTQIEKIDQATAVLAPWKFCDETTDGYDTFDTIKKLAFCSGQASSRLAFDMRMTSEAMEELANLSENNILSKFVMTDGGLVRFHPASAKDIYELNPYNSSLFRMATASDKPLLFVEKLKKKKIIPASTYTLRDEFIGIISDSNKTAEEIMAEEKEDEEVSQPEVHLVKKFTVTKGEDNKWIAGVAGAQLSYEYLQKLFLEVGSSQIGNRELNCSNIEDIRCYLVDLSGFVLTSNQKQSKVKTGDFLGISDPHLMRHLVIDKKYFDERPQFDYQALCESEVDCSTDSAFRISTTFNFIRGFFMSFVNYIANFLYQTNYTIFSALLALYLPLPADSSLLEFGNSIPDGLHRCTTKTSNWFLKPGVLQDGQVIEDNFPVYCPGDLPSLKDYNSTSEIELPEKNCNRIYHIYKLKSIGAIFLLIESPTTTVTLGGEYDEFSGRPVEVQSEECHLPLRYRKRPSECYAQNPMEKTCSRGFSKRSHVSGILILGLLVSAVRRPMV